MNVKFEYTRKQVYIRKKNYFKILIVIILFHYYRFRMVACIYSSYMLYNDFISISNCICYHIYLRRVNTFFFINTNMCINVKLEGCVYPRHMGVCNYINVYGYI